MRVIRFRCLSCGSFLGNISGAPSRCPCCKRMSVYETVEMIVKKDQSRITARAKRKVKGRYE